MHPSACRLRSHRHDEYSVHTVFLVGIKLTRKHICGGQATSALLLTRVLLHKYYLPTGRGFEGFCILDFCQVLGVCSVRTKKNEARQSKISSREPNKSTKVCIWGMCFEYQCTQRIILRSIKPVG
jgi:hypothetical protein